MPEPIKEYTEAGLLEIINALPMAIFVFDQNRRILLANKVSEDFTAKEINLLAGLRPGEALECIHHEKEHRGCGFSDDCSLCQFKANLKQTLASNYAGQMIEACMHLKKKGERILRFSTRPLKLSGQSVALLSVEDLTLEKQHEQVRVEKEKLAAVLETTGGFCHELSQPLQVIMGYCELLEDRKDLPEDVSQAITAVNKEVEKLARLSHDLANITHYKTKTYLKSQIIDIEKSAGE